MEILSNAEVAARVRGAAAARRLTQEQIGAVLGVSKMAVSRRLAGVTPFTPHELSLLAVTFETRVGAFFGEVAA